LADTEGADEVVERKPALAPRLVEAWLRRDPKSEEELEEELGEELGEEEEEAKGELRWWH
jgi:hypothetical protein